MADLTPPKRLLAMVVAVVALATIFSGRGNAQPAVAGPAVEVRDVKFSNVRPSNGGDPWLEATVELDVRGIGGGGAYARFVDRVQVALSIGVRTRGGEFDFYRASAEAVSLEAGRAAIRFYLPAEILKREQINTDPLVWMVEMSVRGQALAPTAGSVSSGLRTAEALRSFKDHVAQAGPRNDGVLVPQYDSPFANEYGRDTPSYVRRGR